MTLVSSIATTLHSVFDNWGYWFLSILSTRLSVDGIPTRQAFWIPLPCIFPSARATTRSQEIDTKLRERSNLLIARQTGRNSLNAIRGATNLTVKKLSQRLPDYHFIYWNGVESQPFRIKDAVDNLPQDYPDFTPIREIEEIIEQREYTTYKPRRKINWFKWIIGLSFLLYISYCVYRLLYF